MFLPHRVAISYSSVRYHRKQGRFDYRVSKNSGSFFPRGVLGEILNLIGSVSEEFPSYSCVCVLFKFEFPTKKEKKY